MCLPQVRTQLMSMMSVLDKSITIISPDRNKKEIGDLRTRIIEAYHTTKVRMNTKMFFFEFVKMILSSSGS